jgi:hypothetical protein
MKVPATMRWLGLALLGILIAAAVSIAASRLASQQIGLASQPISAGDALAPSTTRASPNHRPRREPANHRTPASTEPSAPSSPPSAPSEPPTYSPPPSTVPASPAVPPPEPGHDGERSGNAAGSGADD